MWLYFVDQTGQPTVINNTVYPTPEHATIAGQQVGQALDSRGCALKPAITESKFPNTFLIYESPRVMVYLLRLVSVSAQ